MPLEPLVELALRPWGRPLVGLIQHRTPERLVELRPSFPMPGPNHVCLVRCAPARVDPMIDETRELAALHGLCCMWILDPAAEPADLGHRLTARGIPQVEELDVMVLPVEMTVAWGDPAIEIVDGLRDEATYRAARPCRLPRSRTVALCRASPSASPRRVPTPRAGSAWP